MIAEVWCRNDSSNAVAEVNGESYCATCHPFAVAEARTFVHRDGTGCHKTRPITKADLVERKAGKGGTIVTTTAPMPAVMTSDTYVVTFLFDRNGYAQPNDKVGISPNRKGPGSGLAFSVPLSSLAIEG